MKWRFQLAPTAALIAILTPCCQGRSRVSRYDPAPQQRPFAAGDSFLDFTLNRINPEHTDYGQCLSEGRKVLLDETLERGYFWSNLIALVLLSGCFVVIIYQQKVQTRRQCVTTEVLAQFDQALRNAREQIGAASQKNRELAEALVSLKESTNESTAPPPIRVGVEAAERFFSPPKTRANSSNAIPQPNASLGPVRPKDRHPAAPSSPAQSADQMKLFTPDTDLIMKVNSLEQQLAHSQRDNNTLRRRIADGDRRLESEQRNKNQRNNA